MSKKRLHPKKILLQKVLKDYKNVITFYKICNIITYVIKPGGSHTSLPTLSIIFTRITNIFVLSTSCVICKVLNTFW